MAEREIFLEALEMLTPEARAAYLQKACGPDAALRRKVDELLKEHFSNDSLLAGPALEGEPPAPTVLVAPPEEAPAQMMGCYKLLEKIGEGGFGEVWMADQREPVKRRVALKIIKLGMDTIDGGGGSSTGGVHSVSGTIGQPDAGGPVTNAQYSVTSGFWALPIAVQSPGVPLLTIVPALPGQATVSWTPATPGFILQETLSLSPTNWMNSASGATNPIVVPAALPTKFYRLRKP